MWKHTLEELEQLSSKPLVKKAYLQKEFPLPQTLHKITNNNMIILYMQAK